MTTSTKQKGTRREEEGKTILVVDDHPIMLKAYEMMLQFQGYKIIFAVDGEDGWRKYKEFKPNLIMTDLYMPEVNGIELLKLIRKEDTLTPVIILSGYGDIELVKEAFELGVDDFLAKSRLSSQDFLSDIKKYFNLSAVELKAHRLNNRVSALQEENESLKKQIANLSGQQKSESQSKNNLDYQAICGSVAHSLKGEFFHIAHSIETIQELSDDSLEVREECDVVKRSIEYSQLLLRRLLDYIGLGKPQIEIINVSKLIERIEFLANPRLPSRITLEIQTSEVTKDKTISVDVEQIISVLLELINNATKILRETGGTIELKIEEKDNKLSIAVKDNGSGIPKEIKEKLFKEEVFSKSGLGLGLYLSKKVMETLGGDLKLQSSSKRGTTFTITLPLNEKDS
jgi:signal transduction histidine kinase